MTILAAANIIVAVAIVATTIAIARKTGVSRDAAIVIAAAYGITTFICIAAALGCSFLFGGEITVDRVFNVVAMIGLLFLILCTRSRLVADDRG